MLSSVPASNSIPDSIATEPKTAWELLLNLSENGVLEREWDTSDYQSPCLKAREPCYS